MSRTTRNIVMRSTYVSPRFLAKVGRDGLPVPVAMPDSSGKNGCGIAEVWTADTKRWAKVTAHRAIRRNGKKEVCGNLDG
jgi:hypothetical protein